MEWLAAWLFFALLVGIMAHNRGRTGFGWFILAALLSPLLMGLLVLVLRDLSRAPGLAEPADTPQVRCPDCRELVRADARKCKHCGAALVPRATQDDASVWGEIGAELAEAVKAKAARLARRD